MAKQKGKGEGLCSGECGWKGAAQGAASMAGDVECASPSACLALVACSGVRGHSWPAASQRDSQAAVGAAARPRHGSEAAVVQGTLLRSGPGSTACERLAASVCHRVLVVLLWRVVARRTAADGGAAMVQDQQVAASCSSLLSSAGDERRERRKGERVSRSMRV